MQFNGRACVQHMQSPEFHPYTAKTKIKNNNKHMVCVCDCIVFLLDWLTQSLELDVMLWLNLKGERATWSRSYPTIPSLGRTPSLGFLLKSPKSCMKGKGVSSSFYTSLSTCDLSWNMNRTGWGLEEQSQSLSEKQTKFKQKDQGCDSEYNPKHYSKKKKKTQKCARCK